MEWLQSLNRAIDYMEEHLTDNITCEDVAEHIYISSFHFQRTFNLLTGLTIGEYLRNRRLSLAGQELLKRKDKVIDIALKLLIRINFIVISKSWIYNISKYFQ